MHAYKQKTQHVKLTKAKILQKLYVHTPRRRQFVHPHLLMCTCIHTRVCTHTLTPLQPHSHSSAQPQPRANKSICGCLLPSVMAVQGRGGVTATTCSFTNDSKINGTDRREESDLISPSTDYMGTQNIHCQINVLPSFLQPLSGGRSKMLLPRPCFILAFLLRP